MPRAHDWTILKLLKWTTTYFKSRQIDSPRMTAEILLAHCLKTQRIDLYLDHDRPLSGSELAEFKALIKRRADREPVARVIGSKEFWSMDFQVTGDTLIPRPDTECLVEAALSLLASNNSTRRVLELGTGTGAVTAALASEQPHHLFQHLRVAPEHMEALIEDRALLWPRQKAGGQRMIEIAAILETAHRYRVDRIDHPA